MPSNISNNFRAILKSLLPDSLSSQLSQRSERLNINNDLAQLQYQLNLSSDIEEQVKLVCINPRFKLLQISNEFAQLLALAKQQNCHTVCEIGGASGGSLLLFSQTLAAGASLYSIDFTYSRTRINALETAIQPKQSLHCIPEDSHKDETVSLLKNKLNGKELDLLFIDGDHTFEGVAEDFKKYQPLVKKGGLIAFHDIVPDSKERFGHQLNGNYSGGVPEFWSQIKNNYEYREFINSPDQFGYGIGVIFNK